MSRRHRAMRRDNNEAEIIAALRAAGASVSAIDGEGGEPDLLVGFEGRTELLEVKRPVSRTGRTTGGAAQPVNGGDGVSTAPQLAWRAGWRGKPAVIVSTAAEALEAIGAKGWVVAERVVDELMAANRKTATTRRLLKPRKRDLITSDDAKAIVRAADPCASCSAIGHPRIVGTNRCACGHTWPVPQR